MLTKEQIEQANRQSFERKVAEIMYENIKFSGQLNDYIVHGAIRKIWELHLEQQSKQSGGWVKASVRLPENHKDVVCRFGNNVFMACIMNNLFYSDNQSYHPNLIEWLDENLLAPSINETLLEALKNIEGVIDQSPSCVTYQEMTDMIKRIAIKALSEYGKIS